MRDDEDEDRCRECGRPMPEDDNASDVDEVIENYTIWGALLKKADG